MPCKIEKPCFPLHWLPRDDQGAESTQGWKKKIMEDFKRIRMTARQSGEEMELSMGLSSHN